MDFHGFIQVLTVPDLLLGTHYEPLRKIAEALRPEIDPGVFPDASLDELNGQWFFRAHGLLDRGRGFGPVRAFLEKLVAAAPGSFGLFHYRNHEQDEVPELRGCYRVLTIRRGVIAEGFDPFLAPVRPAFPAAAAGTER